MPPPEPIDRPAGIRHTGTPRHPLQPPQPERPGRASDAPRLRTRRATAAIRYLTARYYLLDSDHEVLGYVVPAAIVDAFTEDVDREGWSTLREDLGRAINSGWVATAPDGYRLTLAGLRILQDG